VERENLKTKYTRDYRIYELKGIAYGISNFRKDRSAGISSLPGDDEFS
jgi:hypothetical protein